MTSVSVADAFAAALERVPERKRRRFRRLLLAKLMATTNVVCPTLAKQRIEESETESCFVDDSELHPFGRCTCGGEGDCDWCNGIAECGL